MKSFIVLAVVIAAALAAPTDVPAAALDQPQRYRFGADGQAVILRYESYNEGIEGYQYGFEGSNGIIQQEQGALENAGTDDEGLVVIGHFEYPGPDGVLYKVTYRADRNGFQPQGAHLPVAKVKYFNI